MPLDSTRVKSPRNDLLQICARSSNNREFALIATSLQTFLQNLSRVDKKSLRDWLNYVPDLIQDI